MPIGNVKKLVSHFFDKKNMWFIKKNLQLYLKLRLKLNTTHHLEFVESQWLKQYVEFNTQRRIEAEKNGDKDGKGLYKLMNNAPYGKTMENLSNRIGVKLISKDYLKWASKPTHMSHKIFFNDLVAMSH